MCQMLSELYLQADGPANICKMHLVLVTRFSIEEIDSMVYFPTKHFSKI